MWKKNKNITKDVLIIGLIWFMLHKFVNRAKTRSVKCTYPLKECWDLYNPWTHHTCHYYSHKVSDICLRIMDKDIFLYNWVQCTRAYILEQIIKIKVFIDNCRLSNVKQLCRDQSVVLILFGCLKIWTCSRNCCSRNSWNNPYSIHW